MDNGRKGERKTFFVKQGRSIFRKWTSYAYKGWKKKSMVKRQKIWYNRLIIENI